MCVRPHAKYGRGGTALPTAGLNLKGGPVQTARLLTRRAGLAVEETRTVGAEGNGVKIGVRNEFTSARLEGAWGWSPWTTTESPYRGARTEACGRDILVIGRRPRRLGRACGRGKRC